MSKWKPLEGYVLRFRTEWEVKGFIQHVHEHYDVPIDKDIMEHMSAPSVIIDGQPYYQIWFIPENIPGLPPLDDFVPRLHRSITKELQHSYMRIVQPETFLEVCAACHENKTTETDSAPVVITSGGLRYRDRVVPWSDIFSFVRSRENTHEG